MRTQAMGSATRHPGDPVGVGKAALLSSSRQDIAPCGSFPRVGRCRLAAPILSVATRPS
jgi:hypothetical protein